MGVSIGAPADIAWKNAPSASLRCDPRWVPNPARSSRCGRVLRLSRVTRVRGRCQSTRPTRCRREPHDWHPIAACNGRCSKERFRAAGGLRNPRRPDGCRTRSSDALLAGYLHPGNHPPVRCRKSVDARAGQAGCSRTHQYLLQRPPDNLTDMILGAHAVVRGGFIGSSLKGLGPESAPMRLYANRFEVIEIRRSRPPSAPRAPDSC